MTSIILTDTANDQTVTFTPEKRDLLRGAYIKAVDGDNNEFTFGGNLYNTDYTKYLLEYLDTKLVESIQ